ncbi:RDD family protein [Rhizobium sp. R339]|uniref:RDD family protein n=1 Tax=Rhizobium sp. R339 TaxID=1764273 RepID=UPI000B52B7B2|nr:RDD family protein [Rhizobium sp. R339]
MDNPAAMQQPVALPSRHFWQRLVAFAVDILIFQAVILVATHYISTALPSNLRFPGWSSIECVPEVPSQLAKRIEEGWPLKPNEFRTTAICELRQFGFGKHQYLQTTVLMEPWDDVSPTQVLTIPLDADGNPVTRAIPAYSNLISGIASTMLIVLTFACFSANGRRTAGKAVFFLEVTTVDGKSPDFGTAVKREILKFSPNLLFNAAAFAISLFPAYPAQDFDALLAMFHDGYTPSDISTIWLYGIWTVTIMGWWLLPFAEWKGQLFYDRICACKVVTTQEASRPIEAPVRQNRPRMYRRLAPIRGSRRRRRRAYLRVPY